MQRLIPCPERASKALSRTVKSSTAESARILASQYNRRLLGFPNEGGSGYKQNRMNERCTRVESLRVGGSMESVPTKCNRGSMTKPCGPGNSVFLKAEYERLKALDFETPIDQPMPPRKQVLNFPVALDAPHEKSAKPWALRQWSIQSSAGFRFSGDDHAFPVQFVVGPTWTRTIRGNPSPSPGQASATREDAICALAR
jgi:hypothetical protein